jgi:uncharacterized membrane protein
VAGEEHVTKVSTNADTSSGSWGDGFWMELYNRNSFIRFHSWQSIFLGIAVIAINLVLGIIPGIGWTIRSLGFLVV